MDIGGDNMSAGVNVNWDTLNSIREETLKKQEEKRSLEDAIKKYVIENTMTGKIKPKTGTTVDWQKFGAPRGMDLGQFEPRQDVGDIKNALDVQKTLGEMSAQREFGNRATLATGLRQPTPTEQAPTATGGGVLFNGGIPATQYPAIKAKESFENRGTMPMFTGNKWEEKNLPRNTFSGQPYQINANVKTPEGFEIAGYDSKGNPMLRKIKSASPLFGNDQQSQPTEQFNSPEEADNSGLPAGTIVLVDGKRYQI